MTVHTAEARGRVMIRPWRVGVLVETTSAAQVRQAILNLSGVWGGLYMPILDVRTSPKDLERLARLYDLDALWADTEAEPLAELLRKPGLAWRGRGPYGPFAREDGFTTGLLPADSLIATATELLLPTWDSDAPDDLILAAAWGPPEALRPPPVGATDARRIPVAELGHANPRGRRIGSLAAGAMHVRREPRDYLDTYRGLHVLRCGHPEDVVRFWNTRSFGVRLGAVPAEGGEHLLHLLAHSWLADEDSEPLTDTKREPVTVWGLDRAAPEVTKAISDLAGRRGLTLRASEDGEPPRFVFEGLRTSFSRPIRTDFRPEARSIDIELPSLPFSGPDPLFPGLVAAQVELHGVRGQDPRLTPSLPPYPRHSELIEQHALASDARQVRVSSTGLVIGVQAHATSLSVPFAFNLDVMRLLFDDPTAVTEQSDDGKFQSRAAEKLGGPFGGFLNQPGVRAALACAAEASGGLSMQQIEGAINRNRGAWPHPVWGREDPKAYVRRQLTHLLHTGIFIATARVHCGHCRVESYISADDLASTMSCEFCGEPFSLALSHGLSKPHWRYRLASHLVPARIEALLPALATTSLLGQFRHVEEPPLSHVLGLKIKLRTREIEVDVAVYLPDRDWTVVLAEVKTANKIDENDIANLEFLHRALTETGVRCIIAFVTLKEAFSTDELGPLRQLVERSRPVTTALGAVVPNLPLVLTGPDLSHHPMSEDHPWRWGDDRTSGIFGTAIASCERNLGLKSYGLEHTADGESVAVVWEDDSA